MRKNVEENNVSNKNMKNIFSCTCLSFRLYSVGCPPTPDGEGGGGQSVWYPSDSIGDLPEISLGRNQSSKSKLDQHQMLLE